MVLTPAADFSALGVYGTTRWQRYRDKTGPLHCLGRAAKTVAVLKVKLVTSRTGEMSYDITRTIHARHTGDVAIQCTQLANL